MALPKYLHPETLEKLGSLELAAREVVEGVRVGLHESPLRGFSTEFAHHRPYVAGDPLRHVDWRVYARNQRYFLKLFEAETDFAATIVLDASRSMHYGSGSVSKLEYAKYLAASLAQIIVSQRDAAGLAVFDDAIRYWLEPSSTRSIVENLARELEGIEPREKTSIGRTLEEIAERVTRRGFVIIISDLLGSPGELGRGLDHLRFRGHNIVIFHVLDPFEIRFPFEGTCRFLGLEDGAEVMTSPRRVRDAYLRELDDFLAQVKRVSDVAAADLVRTDTSEPLDRVLSRYLLERGRTRR